MAKQNQLLRAMLFANEFSVEQLHGFVSLRDGDVALQTVRNYVHKLKKKGYVETIGREPSQGGRPRERLRISRDVQTRRRVYEEAYGEEEPETEFRLTGKAFDKARALISKTKLGLHERNLNQDAVRRLERNLQLAEDFLEIAFSEQEPLARQGPIGEMIRRLADEAADLKVLCRKPRRNRFSGVAPDTWTLICACLQAFIASSRLSTAEACSLVLENVGSASHSKRGKIASLARDVDRSWGRCMTDAEVALSSFGIVAEVLKEEPVRVHFPPIDSLYEMLNPSNSLEATYCRICAYINAGRHKKAYSQWQTLLTQHADQALLSRIKAYQGKKFEQLRFVRAGVVTPRNFPSAFASLRSQARDRWDVEAATGDHLSLSIATGDSSAIGLLASQPITFNFSNGSVLEIPTFSNIQRLFATRGASQLLGVPGPLSMKIAVAFEAARVPPEQALRQAVTVCREEKSVLFVSSAERMPEVSGLPGVRSVQWLPFVPMDP